MDRPRTTRMPAPRRWDPAGAETLNPIEELREHLGDCVDPARLRDPIGRLAADWRRAAPRAAVEILEFYRRSEGYLYALAAWHDQTDRLRRTDALLSWAVRNEVETVLDYGCGIGTDGLWLAASGCEVTFADLECPSLDFLRRRIAARSWESRCRVAPLPDGRPPRQGRWDLGVCMDVLEHLAEPEPVLDFLAEHCTHLAVNAAPCGPEHPMHLPQNAYLAAGGLDTLLGERGFRPPDGSIPWLFTRSAPAAPPRLGIGVLTRNRRSSLAECIRRIETHTETPFELVIADDGSDDGTLAWARHAGYPAVTGHGRGPDCNINRALSHLERHLGCDPILLIRDDTRVWEHGWEREWIEAARRWGAVFWTPEKHHPAGRGTPEDPWWATPVGDHCVGVTARFLRRAGYPDPALAESGLHLELWAAVAGERYAEMWPGCRGYAPCINAHVGSLFTWPDETSRTRLLGRLEVERTMREGVL